MQAIVQEWTRLQFFVSAFEGLDLAATTVASLRRRLCGELGLGSAGLALRERFGWAIRFVGVN